MRRTSRHWSWILVIFVALSARLLLAQSIIDPRIIEFDPSPDHDKVESDGQPTVTRYDLEFYASGASTPIATIALGKPSPDPDGVIRVNFEGSLQPVPPGGVTYVARVAAVGPGGTGRSAPSNDFTFQSGCTVSVNPATLSLAGGASTGTIFVTAPAGCPWSASAMGAWVTITSGATGAGSGSVAYSVAANSAMSPRSASIALGGLTIPITQAGASCSYSVAPANTTVAPAGGTGSVTVSSAGGCAWTAASGAAWITVTSGASGQGNGTVGYSVAAYTGTTSRTGTLTIGGRTFTVTQNGVACSPSIAPAAVTVPSTGATNGTVAVSAGAACSWTAASNVSWISVTSGASGQGAATVGFTVAPLTGTSARTGTLTVAGQTFTVTQTGIGCTYAVTSSTLPVTSAGGSMTADVTAPPGCTWTASENVSWISITSGATGTGNGTVRFSVTANAGTSSRTAALTVAGHPVTVTQSGNSCTYTVTPATQSVARPGGPMTATVTAQAGCSWRATESVGWISISSGASGTGNGTVRYNVTAYTGTSSRTATLTIAGRPVSVTQSSSAGPTAPVGLRIVGK